MIYLGEMTRPDLEEEIDILAVPGLVHMSRDARKLVFRVSDQVRHKPACTVSEKD